MKKIKFPQILRYNVCKKIIGVVAELDLKKFEKIIQKLFPGIDLEKDIEVLNKNNREFEDFEMQTKPLVEGGEFKNGVEE